jgi:hypothetical protein
VDSRWAATCSWIDRQLNGAEPHEIRSPRLSVRTADVADPLQRAQQAPSDGYLADPDWY